jgi:hypothetical protein
MGSFCAISSMSSSASRRLSRPISLAVASATSMRSAGRCRALPSAQRAVQSVSIERPRRLADRIARGRAELGDRFRGAVHEGKREGFGCFKQCRVAKQSWQAPRGSANDCRFATRSPDQEINSHRSARTGLSRVLRQRLRRLRRRAPWKCGAEGSQTHSRSVIGRPRATLYSAPILARSCGSHLRARERKDGPRAGISRLLMRGTTA